MAVFTITHGSIYIGMMAAAGIYGYYRFTTYKYLL
jgi:hypothetical protein